MQMASYDREVMRKIMWIVSFDGNMAQTREYQLI